MKIMNFVMCAITCVIFFCAQKVVAMAPAPSDPVAQINYVNAFNQDKIYDQFRSLMYELGCAENVFGKNVPIDSSVDFQCYSNNKAAYESACLAHLRTTKNWAIAEGARETLSLLSITIAATCISAKMVDSHSFAGGLSVFTAFSSSVYLLRDAIRSAYQFSFPPAHALNALEERFAKNKCYIPKDLWPAIIERFTIARQNTFEQRRCMEFIEFTLGLTMCKKEPIRLHGLTAEQFIDELSQRIDQFFLQYDDGGDKRYVWDLKINVSKFMHMLAHGGYQSPRYILLRGHSGIGKTHFVRALYTWIEELMPSIVRFEQMNIADAHELEGTDQCPGALLRVTRNQLLANNRGSIVFMDEATWLNSYDMLSASKRVFNGDQTQLKTTYFGDGIDGAGIAMCVPPMLIIVAMNDDIKDATLKSRFDVIEFPSPQQESLVAYANKVLCNSPMFKQTTNCVYDESVIRAWIQNLKKEDCNFRYVAANIEAFMLNYRLPVVYK